MRHLRRAVPFVDGIAEFGLMGLGGHLILMLALDHSKVQTLEVTVSLLV